MCIVPSVSGWLVYLTSTSVHRIIVSNDGRLRDHASRNMRSNARTDCAATPSLCATLLNFMK